MSDRNRTPQNTPKLLQHLINPQHNGTVLLPCPKRSLQNRQQPGRPRCCRLGKVRFPSPSPSHNHVSHSPPRKKAVSTQTTELEALEARLKATEERLKARGASPLPGEKAPSGRSSPRQRAPLAGDTFTDTKPEERAPTSPLSSQPPITGSRPQTANRPKTGNRGDSGALPPMPGALPPTPGASEGELSSSESEYVLVKGRADHSGVQDGDDAAQQ